jgi:hypothetical protein
MGESLASFRTKESAVKFVKTTDDTLYTWSQIQQHFQTK